MPGAVADTADGWALDWGGTLVRQVSSAAMRDVAGNGFGLDLSLRVTPPGWHLGVRIGGAAAKYATTKTRTEGEFCFFGCYPVSGTASTSHTITRLLAGPQWSMPLGKARYTLYALAGITRVEPEFSGSAVGVSNEPPPSSTATIGALGSDLILPIELRGAVRFEVGVEFYSGGKATFFGNPPIIPDGSNRYLYLSERARVSGFAVRGGIVKRYP